MLICIANAIWRWVKKIVCLVVIFWHSGILQHINSQTSFLGKSKLYENRTFITLCRKGVVMVLGNNANVQSVHYLIEYISILINFIHSSVTCKRKHILTGCSRTIMYGNFRKHYHLSMSNCFQCLDDICTKFYKTEIKF